MNENIQLEMNPSVKKQSSIDTSIALFSQDIDNYSFDITFTDLKLQAGDQVEVLAKLQDGRVEHKSSANLVEVDGELIARYIFDTKLISRRSHVFCYVYLKRGDKSADVGAFYFEVDLSELDKVGGKIAEVYDGRYEDLVADFEQSLSDYKDTLPQADSVRADFDVILNQFGVDSQQVIGDLGEVSATVEIAEASRVEKESERVQAETERIQAEQARKEAETERELAESARQNEFEANETSRQTNELVRVSNEAERISKDSERDSKIEAVEERIEENEEGLEQHKMDYVEDTKRVRATEPLGKLLAYDTFNRPDGILGVSDSGHEWLSYGTPAVISSGSHKGMSTNSTLYDVSAIVLDDKVRSSVLKVDVFTDGVARGAGLFLGVDQKNGISLFSLNSRFSLSKIVEGVRTDLYQSDTYPPWGETDSDWYMKERVLQTLELTTVYVDSAVLFNVKLILNGVEFSEKMKITDPETLGIISNADKAGITQTHRYWHAKNFVVRGLRV